MQHGCLLNLGLGHSNIALLKSFRALELHCIQVRKYVELILIWRLPFLLNRIVVAVELI